MRGLTCKPHTKFKPISANPPHQNSKLLKTMKQISIPPSIASILKLSDLNRLVENERIESNAEATRLRIQCLDELTELESQRQTAAADVAKAIERVEAARAALERAQAVLCPIESVKRELDAQWQAKSTRLMTQYGEAVVHAGLFRLHLFEQQAATNLQAVESNGLINVCDSLGRVQYRYQNPGQKEKITEASDRLADLKKAAKRMTALVQSRVSPDELAAAVNAILVAAGCPFPKEEQAETVH